MSSVQDFIDEFNDHGFTDTSVTRKVALLNDTLWDICSREPWPFLEKSVVLTFDGTSPTPTNLPSDFRSLLSLVNVSTGVPLDPERYDVMERQHGADRLTGGTPNTYYFLNDTLNIYFIPDVATTLRLTYLANHPVLSQSSVEADILLPKEFHRAISLGTLYKLYDMDDDFDLAASFQAQYEDRLMKMRNQLWERNYDRPDRVYGIDDFDLQFLG